LGKWVGILKLISVVQVVFFFFSLLFSYYHFLIFLDFFLKNWIETKKAPPFFLGLKYNDFLKNIFQHLKKKILKSLKNHHISIHVFK